MTPEPAGPRPGGPERLIMSGSGVKRSLVLGLFFFSGAAGLAYEVVWARQLSLLLGVSVYAVSAVLVAFMGGLGLGAELSGKAITRGVAPIRLYAVLEACLGIYVLAFPLVLAALEKVYLAVHVGGEGATAYVIGLRFALAVAALTLPTALMGGTLPALVRGFARDTDKGHGRTAGWLYAVNTLGAMTGCLAAGFFMIESFGLTTTLNIGACVNLAIGAIAWLAAGESSWKIAPAPEPAQDKKKKGKQKPSPAAEGPDGLLVALYGLSGFCALALELLWTRLLILLVNNTTYAFSLILSVFLLGIGAGSAIASRLPRPSAGKNLAFFAFFLGGVGVMALFSLIGMRANQELIGALDSMVSAKGFIAGTIPGGEPVATAILFSLLIVTPCTLLMGAGFPLVVEAISAGREKIAAQVGRLYAVNIAGCVLGSLLAGYAMIPLLGIQTSVIIVAWMAIAGGGYLVAARLPGLRRAGAAAVFAVAAPMTVYLLIRPDIAYLLSAQKLDLGSEVEFYEEGPSATVLVSSQETDLSPGRKPVKRIWINGDPIAGAFREALQLERLQAHIPLLLHKNPKNALVICFGTGSTAGAALAHGLENVVAVDISREVFNAGPKFSEGNLNALESPRLSIVEEDGRNFLLTTGRKFDFITSEPPPPSNAGIVSLYTKEYYDLCKKRLAKGGLVSQWIPLHHLSESDFKSLVASFTAAFPRGAMWYTKWDAIMIGAEGDVDIDLAELDRKMQLPAVKASLAGIGITSSRQLAANYMMGPEKLREYLGGAEPVYDDWPKVEFTAPRAHATGVEVKGGNLAGILEFRAPPPLKGATEEHREAFDRSFLSQTVFFRGQVALNYEKRAEAAQLFSRALDISGDNPDARYAYLSLNLKALYSALAQGRAELGLKMLEDTRRLDTENLFAAQLKFLRGMFLAKIGSLYEAEYELRGALDIDPGYFLAVVNLAGLYESGLGKPEKAKELYLNALALNPSSAERRAIDEALKKLDSNHGGA